MTTVSDVLKMKERRALLTVDASTTVREAARFFLEYEIASFPVEEEGEICGIVTGRDLTRVLAVPDENLDDITVAELVREHVIVAYPSDKVTEAMHVMASSHIHHMPVVENGAVVGMISMSDLVRAVSGGNAKNLRLRYLDKGVCLVCGGKDADQKLKTHGEHETVASPNRGCGRSTERRWPRPVPNPPKVLL